MQQTERRALLAEDLKEAARLRFMEGLSWDRIAKRLKCDRSTLHRWRNRGGAWQKAVEEVVAEMRYQGEPTAWGALLRSAQHNDIAAAKEILNRIVGAVPQELNLKHDYRHLSAEDLAAIAGTGTGGASAEGGEGGED